MYYKTLESIIKTSWDKSITQSEYNNWFYDDYVSQPIILGQVEIEIPVYCTNAKGEQEIAYTEKRMEIQHKTTLCKRIVEDWTEVEQKEIVTELVKVTKNRYDNGSYVIIPDDAVLLSEKEYQKEIDKMKVQRFDSQTKENTDLVEEEKEDKVRENKTKEHKKDKR